MVVIPANVTPHSKMKHILKMKQSAFWASMSRSIQNIVPNMWVWHLESGIRACLACPWITSLVLTHRAAGDWLTVAEEHCDFQLTSKQDPTNWVVFQVSLID
jgi:hypothetical protein